MTNAEKDRRSHLEKDIYENMTVSNWLVLQYSIDLIYALPGQTMAQVKDNVAK